METDFVMESNKAGYKVPCTGRLLVGNGRGAEFTDFTIGQQCWLNTDRPTDYSSDQEGGL